MNNRIQIKDANRIVIKVGTSTLTYENGNINLTRIERLTRIISDLMNSGKEIVLVTSGAIGVGSSKLKLKVKPQTIREKQAVASIGQCELMHIYSKFFGEYSHTVGQVLLTRDVIEDDHVRNNVCNTFNTLLEMGVVPIVNENDTVSIDEIENIVRFGDNDNLSAIVSKLCNADLLIILSDIDGFYDKDPRNNEDAKLLNEVHEITEELEKAAGGAGTNFGTGGMITKLTAAKTATNSGIDMVLANGEEPKIILDILNGKEIGTLFLKIERGIKMSELIRKGKNAKEASYILANLTTTDKDRALESMAKNLLENADNIIEENKKDLKKAVENGTSKAMLDRLSLDKSRIEGMADGLMQIINLQDPVGEVIGMWNRPNGLQIGQKRVPIGVIGIIYEARPNVTCDAAGLCLKSGNAVILRGGKEAINSNIAIIKALRQGLKEANITEDAVQLVEDTSREVATEMMKLNDYIDVLIPRGGAGLIKAVVNNATVPVIETGTGNCHIYIDSECDFEMAKNIVVNAKTSRPAVCNAAESLVIHEGVAEELLPILAQALRDKDVVLRGDKKQEK